MTLLNEYQNSTSLRKRFKNYTKNTCSTKLLKKRLPIIKWLPKYSIPFFIQDIIAGITVGLTAIPQGIAYAVVAGLSPEYGLYASLTSGFVYIIFGSCKDVTVGPTAIVSALVAKYVAGYSSDFAILAAFLSGVLILLMGIFNLGFLVEFISMPVIKGFTIAGALQIASSQLKSFFALAGSSGNYFAESVYNFAINIKTARLWDPILATVTIIMLILLQKLGVGCKRTDGLLKQIRWFTSLGRNAVVVIIGMCVAYVIKITTDSEPLALVGEIGNGLPNIGLPPFNTIVGNETYLFSDMLQVLGPQSIVLPLVIILESVAISKAFAEGGKVDATQEMIALGLCNIIGSFARSMPITGSFTRTALNYASGVQTQAGGVTKCLLIIVALTFLTSTFYYIPKASLAGLIIVAMFSMIDYEIFPKLWKASKREFFLLLITIIVCLCAGLEYGIVTGVVTEALMLLFNRSRPVIGVHTLKHDTGDITLISLPEVISYCAAEHLRRLLFKVSLKFDINCVTVIDGTNLRSMDSTVATNILSVIEDYQKRGRCVWLLNFNCNVQKLCTVINGNIADKFVSAPNALDLAVAFHKRV
ncbi:sodium-independent sulfate anion transporter-like [Galleria mellonella]|uniref:Sodium-independent sulfate anion transporter-like n=1 Tax=Galleria mellonella TaxID=7137 RepID=A0ABM3M840_GALME|nr:sodium-independent sulfate anion transporter-like [Galleria mellonella]